MTHIVMLSGGRDSSCLTLKLLKEGYPVDYIVFSDTLHEFDEMYEYIGKLDAFFQRRYGKKIVRLKPKNTFEHWVFGEGTRGEMEGMIRGLPKVLEPCYWRRESKVLPFERWVKENNIGEHKLYIGYTYSELQRAKVKQDNFLYPLIDWKMTERDVSAYLRENEMENKLYQHFTRTGCYFCPKMSDMAYYKTWENYPKKWEYMKDMENKLGGAFNDRWHIKKSLSQLEKEFEIKSKQQVLDLDFEAPADCFCKI